MKLVTQLGNQERACASGCQACRRKVTCARAGHGFSPPVEAGNQTARWAPELGMRVVWMLERRASSRELNNPAHAQ